MDAEAEWSCPICHDTRNDVAYAMPCHHQFCVGCIVRWTLRKPDCPLCRRQIETIRFSELEEGNYLYLVITPSEESTDASSQARRSPGCPAENSPHSPVVSPPSSPQGMLSPAEEGTVRPEATLGNLLPEVWAELFQRHRELLNPVVLWLRQELEEIYGARWWEVNRAGSTILHALCIHGPDEEVMVQVLQDCLQEYTAPLVNGIINVIMHRCSNWAHWLLGEGPQPSPTASRAGTPDSSLAASSSPAGSDEEEEAGTSEAALGGGPGRPPSAPIPAEQEQPQEELGELVGVAGPSAQGCSRSPSAPGRGRDHSPGGPRRVPKRRAPGPQDSPQPCKRPPHRQH
ncbi:TOPRS ligase, partial [Pelecanoides urinatrix]|nr:TOPRS ligase [Pelecanoides urinatrix]